MSKYTIDGKFYDYPQEKTDYHIFYTDVGNRCPHCGTVSPYRHVVDDSCERCVIETYDSVNSSLPPGMVVKRKVCKNGGHLVVTRPGKRKCLICADTPTPRQAAIAAGEKWYDSGETCQHCSQPIQKSVTNGRKRCGCPSTLSPRQAAIAAGEKWYDSGETCQHCNEEIEKRVQDSFKRCGCNRKEKVVSPRQQAVRAGEKWYDCGVVCDRCGFPILKRVNNGEE